MELCRSLRWKSFHGGGFRSEQEALEVALRNEVPFSCLRTCRTWGPDDLAATPELCSSERTCFERSPLARLPSGGEVS